MTMTLSAEKKVKQFFSRYPARNWPDKQIIIHAGDKPQGIYLLESGNIRQYTIDAKGNEITVNTFHSPVYIPMSWAFSPEPCKYFFETVGPTALRCAPKEQVLKFVKDNPDVALDLLARLYSGMDGVLMRMVHLMSSSAHIRVIYELVVHAKRAHPKSKKNVLLDLKEYQIGSYCGLTKETVSREFNKLKAKNLVSIDSGGITIKDLSALEEELEKYS